MKTFKQFTEENKLNTSNTKEALKNVLQEKILGNCSKKYKEEKLTLEI